MQLKKNIIQICITITSHNSNQKKNASQHHNRLIFANGALWHHWTRIASPDAVVRCVVDVRPIGGWESRPEDLQVHRRYVSHSPTSFEPKHLHGGVGGYTEGKSTSWEPGGMNDKKQMPKNYLQSYGDSYLYIYMYIYICIFIIFYQLIRQEVMKHQQYFLGWMLLFSLFVYVLVLEGFQCVICLSIGRIWLAWMNNWLRSAFKQEKPLGNLWWSFQSLWVEKDQPKNDQGEVLKKLILPLVLFFDAAVITTYSSSHSHRREMAPLLRWVWSQKKSCSFILPF